jgi:hypothetical protein
MQSPDWDYMIDMLGRAKIAYDHITGGELMERWRRVEPYADRVIIVSNTAWLFDVNGVLFGVQANDVT